MAVKRSPTRTQAPAIGASPAFVRNLDDDTRPRHTARMRDLATADSVRQFVQALGRACTGPGCVNLVGGATAVLLGWRNTTVDIDLKLDPEPEGAFALSHLERYPHLDAVSLREKVDAFMQVTQRVP